MYSKFHCVTWKIWKQIFLIPYLQNEITCSKLQVPNRNVGYIIHKSVRYLYITLSYYIYVYMPNIL